MDKILKKEQRKNFIYMQHDEPMRLGRLLTGTWVEHGSYQMDDSKATIPLKVLSSIDNNL